MSSERYDVKTTQVFNLYMAQINMNYDLDVARADLYNVK